MKRPDSRSDEPWATNRGKKFAPKKASFWCDKCDAMHVGAWTKCERCGHRSGRRRFKK